VEDQTSVPTPSTFLAQSTARLLTRSAEGLLHLVPSGQASRYEFACEVVRALGSASHVEPARTSDFPSPAARPTYSVLDNRRAAGLLQKDVAHWKSLLSLDT